MTEKSGDRVVDRDFLANVSREVSGFAPRLDGSSTVRLGVGPADEYVKAESPDFVFSIFVFEAKSGGEYAVFTDLQRTVEEQFFAVTTLAAVVLDDPPEEGLSEAQGVALGHWVAHTAYDTAAMNLRVAAANHSSINDLNLPLRPDDYSVRFWSREKIAAEEAAEEAAESDEHGS